MEDLVKVYEKKSEAVRSRMAKRHTASYQDAKESGTVHGTWQFENLMLSYIRDGEVEKLRTFLTLKSYKLYSNPLEPRKINTQHRRNAHFIGIWACFCVEYIL